MMQDKQQLSAAQIEAQAAFELPDREMMALVNITLIDVLSGNEVAVQELTTLRHRPHGCGPRSLLWKCPITLL